MRVLRLILLGLLAYIVTVVFIFPAAPVINRIKPQIQPVQLTGVEGRLFSGKVADVKYADDLLPLEFQDVAWKLAPSTLLKGGTGANVTFAGYGGNGEAQVRRQFSGDLYVTDVDFNVQSKELEALLPAPITEFSGKIDGDFDKIEIVDQLLQAISGKLVWNDAIIVTRIYGPEITVNLGQFNVDIEPADNAEHKVTLKSEGGDLAIDGTVDLSANGDYRTNMLLTPSATAQPELQDILSRLTRPEGNGSFRIQHNGNMNQGT